MKKGIFISSIAVICLLFTNFSRAESRGIYLTQHTAMRPATLEKFIIPSQKNNLNSFVVDIKYKSKGYPAMVNALHRHHLLNIARIVVFPNANPQNILSKTYWEKRMQLVDYAIDHGADAIQLDYIRYSTKNSFNFHKNINNITRVVAFFHKNIHRRVPLEVDIFGITSYEPQRIIGQDARALAPYVEALCPMVYPSHYAHPHNHPSNAFNTVSTSLIALKKQLEKYPKVNIYAYIEINNYRYPMTFNRKIDYVRDEIRAVNKANINGWYAWSPQHYYGALFRALSHKPDSDKRA